ncbi:hypothetical protein BDE02_13G036100 [Populus trichocarpa]|nr:hypothetical protein BDE02_13G036100 [Populus trichocarpa]
MLSKRESLFLAQQMYMEPMLMKFFLESYQERGRVQIATMFGIMKAEPRMTVKGYP